MARWWRRQTPVQQDRIAIDTLAAYLSDRLDGAI